MPKTQLFDKATNWGVTKNGHVAHLIDGKNGIVIEENKQGSYNKVSHEELFINEGDNKTTSNKQEKQDITNTKDCR